MSFRNSHANKLTGRWCLLHEGCWAVERVTREAVVERHEVRETIDLEGRGSGEGVRVGEGEVKEMVGKG